MLLLDFCLVVGKLAVEGRLAGLALAMFAMEGGFGDTPKGSAWGGNLADDECRFVWWLAGGWCSAKFIRRCKVSLPYIQEHRVGVKAILYMNGLKDAGVRARQRQNI